MIERNWSEIYSYFNIFSRCFLKFSSPRDKTFLGHSSLANSTRSTSSIRSCTRESGCLQHRRASGFWEHGNSQGNMKPRDRDSRHMYTKTTRFRCQVCSTFAGSIGLSRRHFSCARWSAIGPKAIELKSRLCYHAIVTKWKKSSYYLQAETENINLKLYIQFLNWNSSFLSASWTDSSYVFRAFSQHVVSDGFGSGHACAWCADSVGTNVGVPTYFYWTCAGADGFIWDTPMPGQVTKKIQCKLAMLWNFDRQINELSM